VAASAAALQALALASSDDCDALRDAGALPLLVNLLSCRSPEVVQAASAAIAAASSDNDANKTVLIDSGAMTQLSSALQTRATPGVSSSAALALARLADVSRNPTPMPGSPRGAARAGMATPLPQDVLSSGVVGHLVEQLGGHHE
jgi:hypothetical protein